MDKSKVYLEVPEFTGENVPVAVAARVMKKDQQFIRQGIILGFLKFGVAFKKEGSSQYDYYISPMKFWCWDSHFRWTVSDAGKVRVFAVVDCSVWQKTGMGSDRNCCNSGFDYWIGCNKYPSVVVSAT